MSRKLYQACYEQWNNNKRKQKKIQDFIIGKLIMCEISAGADGGHRFQVCARLTLRSATNRHQQKFVYARANKIKTCLVNFLAISSNSKHLT
jgi:hypothetical protein